MTNQTRNLTADETYNKNQFQLKENLKRLQKLADAHKREFRGTSRRNWGYAGDLGHVNEILQQAINFLAQEEN